jgi:Zn-dependent protease with chaperone function
MMAAVKVPYPPSPVDVPDDLTDFPASYKSKQNLLLIGLFVFLLFYFGLIALTVLLGTYCFFTLSEWPAVKMIGVGACFLTFLFLVKGFFKRHAEEKELRIEITEEEQPVLFAFIHQLCEELDAPEPNKVYVSTDVNAAVIPRASLINLIKEPKKDLLIGLGLVNCINLSEFKSVMAHEFGHFCQSGYIASYSYVASKIILDIIVGEDMLDRMVQWCQRQDGVIALFGYVIGAPLWVGKKLLEAAFKVITMQRLAVSREQEFHADLVAVKAAGSDAVGLSLMRLRFGNICLNQAMSDLDVASENKLYTRDLFYHQDRAEPIVRRLRKDPKLGVRPESDDPMAGKMIRVFDPDKEEEEHDEIPEMRRTHPPAHETEENAKETFIPAVVDIRSPWILFKDVDELKERLTYKFYRMVFRVKKTVELAEPEEVQQFIDDEYAETTYHERYQGVYDIRPLEPGDIGELNAIIRDTPWDNDRLLKVHERMYDGAGDKAEEFEELRKERQTLQNKIEGKPSRRMKKKLKDIEKDMDKLKDWFKSLDRRVYLCYVQMAAKVNKEWRDELVERYRFGLEIQKFYVEADHHFDQAYMFIQILNHLDQPHPEFIGEFLSVMRKAWRALKNIVKDARDINMPAMKNFEEGERLADFILDGKLVSEPPLEYVKSNWINKMMSQLRGVRRRCLRLHWKSVGGILAMQEKIAEAFVSGHGPVEAMVVEPPPPAPLEAVVVAETVLDAAEVLDVEAVDDEPIEAIPVVVHVAAEPSTPFDLEKTFIPHVDALVATAARAAPSEIVEAEPTFVVPDLPVPVPDPEPEHVFIPPTADDEFPLDLDAHKPPEPPPPVHVDLPETFDLDATKASAPVASEPAPSPIHSIFGESIRKPAKNSRPAIRITFIRAGEPSPLTK